MSDLEFRFNEDNHIEFNDKAESNDEDKVESNKENEIEIFETKNTKCMAMQILKAGTKPSMIYKAIRGENGEPIATRRDISNLGAQIYHSKENASMEILIINMEKRGYTVHHENYEVEQLIYTGDYKMLNLAIASYKILASSSLNANEDDES
ncbi:11373_t:CDS:2 [Racocetra persica]|uniref:11373_t:CDS:1 n=1 Tax=Racocetra persica TaxID=160502 RepID=A0ACA9PZN9_9GLOM|nr:11373_t:CDS:2 [Racocetra persica]